MPFIDLQLFSRFHFLVLQFTAEKVMSDSDEYPQLRAVLKECNDTGTFTLLTEAVSTWKYLFSTRNLVLSSVDTFDCTIRKDRSLDSP